MNNSKSVPEQQLESLVGVDPNQRRLGGVARLFGEDGFAALQKAHVLVVGLGGVGSWAAEALARNGVGALTLVDLDHIAESNVNRQVHALTQTLGQSKVLRVILVNRKWQRWQIDF